MNAAGHTVYSSDLRDYDFGLGGYDFLAARGAPPGCQAIVTNPPFKHAQAFVQKGLELAPLVITLLRLAFLESERRSDILDGGRLAQVHVFKNRLPMIHRDGWQGAKTDSGAIAFAWFVWRTDHSGPATINRISWKPVDDR